MTSTIELAFRRKVEQLQKLKREEEREAKILQGIFEDDELQLHKSLFKQLLEEQIRPEIRHIFYQEVNFKDFY